jgi:AraC-like DNA-binding protein
MNSQLAQCIELKKGTYAQGLTIQISEKWLRDKISGQNIFDYKFFKQKEIFQSFINPKSQKLLSEIFTENKSFVPALYMNNRVTRLLETFLDNFLKKGFENNFPSSAEAGKLIKVNSFLLENYDTGFPHIDQLARVALMSVSKLKKDFKKSFNMGMYAYYQKNRMHIAKELLVSGKYSISEVGNKVGYKNMSNFASAFKKEFHHLPKDFKKMI